MIKHCLLKEKINVSRAELINLYKHITATDLEKQIENFDKYFKFTFVRNPYARFVSWVYYYHELHGLYKHDKSNLDKYSFKELIQNF